MFKLPKFHKLFENYFFWLSEAPITSDMDWPFVRVMILASRLSFYRGFTFLLEFWHYFLHFIVYLLVFCIVFNFNSELLYLQKSIYSFFLKTPLPLWSWVKNLPLDTHCLISIPIMWRTDPIKLYKKNSL